jgi:general secretion pathway protein L
MARSRPWPCCRWLAARALFTQAPGDDDADPLPVRAEPAVAALAERACWAARSSCAPPASAPWRRRDWDLAQFELASSGRTRLMRRLAAPRARLARAPRVARRALARARHWPRRS